MAEGVERAANFNAVDDLMNVHRGQGTREEAFKKNCDEYAAGFAKNAELEEKRKAICGTIQNNGQAFMSVAGGGIANPATQ